jgi:hypothetical protein
LLILALTKAALSYKSVVAYYETYPTHEVGLGSDLERDTAGGGLGVVDSLGTSLDVLANSVVVGSGKGGQVAETVEGDGVVGGGVTEGTGVSGDGTGSDVVRSLGTDKETVSANNSVGSEGGALSVSIKAPLLTFGDPP